SLSGVHRVAWHRFRIQDRVRLDLWLPPDHVGYRRRHPDHRSTTSARRAQHGGDAEPADHARGHSGGDSHRAVGLADRRRAGDRRRVVSEMLISSAGVGYLISRYRTILESAHVFAGVLLVLVLAVAFNLLIRLIE